MSKVDIARKIRDKGYDCDKICTCEQCPFDPETCWGAESIKEEGWSDTVDKYIKRYSRAVKKSFTTDRPNFRKALKDKKEFKVKVTPELSKELQKIAFKHGKEWCEPPTKSPKYLNTQYLYVHEKYLGTSDQHLTFERSHFSEYNSTADTFSDHIPEAEKKEEPETLKTPIIKIKTDCVVLTEEEFNRLKKIEEDYILIKKVLED